MSTVRSAARSAAQGRRALRVAAAVYAGTCLLGASVFTGVVDTRRFRWLHHAFYIATVTTTGLAAAALIRTHPRAAAALVGAAPSLVIVSQVSARSRWHPVIALAAAPAYVAATALAGARARRSG